jgi:hypothetical protein
VAQSFARLTESFFDRDLVKRKLDAATRRVLSKFGAFVQRRDKSSLRYETGKRKKSAAGQTPVVHRSEKFTRQSKNRKTGQVTRRPASPLKELVFFAFDQARNSVVIGPEAFRNSKLGGGVVPPLVEYGGTGPFLDPETGERKTGHWAPRPHLVPAFEVERQLQLPGLFANALR